MNEELNATGLVPTADKVLVEPTKVEEKHGSLYLPVLTQEKEQLAQQIGTVIAMGETAANCPEMAGIKVGDQIFYIRYTGEEFRIDGVPYRIMRARDVLGKATRLPDSVIRGARSSVEVFGMNNVQEAAD